jgi:hypothetical protein
MDVRVNPSDNAVPYAALLFLLGSGLSLPFFLNFFLDKL